MSNNVGMLGGLVKSPVKGESKLQTKTKNPQMHKTMKSSEQRMGEEWVPTGKPKNTCTHGQSKAQDEPKQSRPPFRVAGLLSRTSSSESR